MSPPPVFRVLVALICAAAAEPTRYSYNSSDLSYLSNGIQFPVPASELHNPLVEGVFQGNVSEVRWLAGLFDHLKWPQMGPKLNGSRCRRDVDLYVDELRNGTSWAAKSQYHFLQ
jgi:hypothetical protein